MVNYYLLVGFSFFLSIVIIALILYIIRLKGNISALKKRPTTHTVELQAFLSDLMAGEGLVSVHRVDPNGLFTFSPKDTNV